MAEAGSNTARTNFVIGEAAEKVRTWCAEILESQAKSGKINDGKPANEGPVEHEAVSFSVHMKFNCIEPTQGETNNKHANGQRNFHLTPHRIRD